jgi:radical SAM protein with 4Fe4S-binding SPASM domain
VATCTVGANGEVRPCSHLDISYGNILEEPFLEIWGRMDDWRRGDHLPTQCRACSARSLCGGGCRMEGRMRSGGSLNVIDPYAMPETVEHFLPVIRGWAEQRRVRFDARYSDDNLRYRLRNVRSRKEAFGATLVGEGARDRAFLNHEGFLVFSQLQPREWYAVNDPMVHWGQVDSRVHSRIYCNARMLIKYLDRR